MFRRREIFALGFPLGAGVMFGAAGLIYPTWGPPLFALGAFMTAGSLLYLRLRFFPSIVVAVVIGSAVFVTVKHYEPPPAYTGPKFSDIQRIKVLPSSLGGNDTLNIANLATLRFSGRYTLSEIYLIFDPTTQKYPPEERPGMKIQDFTVIYGYNKMYKFDGVENKRHTIEVEGRTFIVILEEINILPVKDVAAPYEYVFAISEK